MLASGLMLTGLGPGTPMPFLLSAYAVFGFGFAMVSPPIANTAVSEMPAAQAGVAAAVATTSRQAGIALGVAVFGAVTGGWWIVAALGLAVTVLGHLATTEWALATARRTAARLAEREPDPEPAVTNPGSWDGTRRSDRRRFSVI